MFHVRTFIAKDSHSEYMLEDGFDIMSMSSFASACDNYGMEYLYDNDLDSVDIHFECLDADGALVNEQNVFFSKGSF